MLGHTVLGCFKFGSLLFMVFELPGVQCSVVSGGEAECGEFAVNKLCG